MPVATGPLPRATGLPMVIITVAAGNVLVIPLARRLGLAHFVARVERAPRPTLTLHLLATFTGPFAGPFSQGPKADAQTQQTNTCQLPDARRHGVPLGRKNCNQRQSTAPTTQAN
ncbi:hypothetical protein D9M71_572770 [compost metagenome]